MKLVKSFVGVLTFELDAHFECTCIFLLHRYDYQNSMNVFTDCFDGLLTLQYVTQ